MAVAIDRVKRETDRAVSVERWRWNRAVKLREMDVEERVVDDVSVYRVNIPADIAQDTSVVFTKHYVASSFNLAAVTLPAGTRAVQVAGDLENQRSTSGRGRCLSRRGRL